MHKKILFLLAFIPCFFLFKALATLKPQAGSRIQPNVAQPVSDRSFHGSGGREGGVEEYAIWRWETIKEKCPREDAMGK